MPEAWAMLFLSLLKLHEFNGRRMFSHGFQSFSLIIREKGHVFPVFVNQKFAFLCPLVDCSPETSVNLLDSPVLFI